MDNVSQFVTEVANRGREALLLLVESSNYAATFNRSPTDFPVEVSELKKAGLTSNDLRALIYSQVLEQVPRVRSRSKAGGHIVIPETAHFILTSAGFALSRRLLGENSADNLVLTDETDPFLGDRKDAIRKPKWDVDKRELYLGEALVKRFKVPAMNQVRILNVFEEEYWPRRVDDPLPMTPGIDPKRRLHHAINSLNRKQARQIVRFMGDGTGTGVCWESRELTDHNGLV